MMVHIVLGGVRGLKDRKWTSHQGSSKEVRSDARSRKHSILSLSICAPFQGRVLEPCTTLTHMLYPGQYADQAKAVVKFCLKYTLSMTELGTWMVSLTSPPSH